MACMPPLYFDGETCCQTGHMNKIEPNDKPFTKEEVAQGFSAKPMNIIGRRAVRNRNYRKFEEEQNDY